MFDLKKQYLGNFTPNDGTIDFYLRVNSLLKPEFTVLDLGGGRGAWMEDDCNIRKSLRLIKGKVKKVVVADIDPIVMQNKSADENLIIDNNFENLPSNSYDLIICDWVLEHIEQPQIFFNNIKRILKDGGFFCARTPHKYSYWAIANRLVPEKIALKILKHVQPFRQAKDVFPAFYYLNTMQDIKKNINDMQDYSFIYRSEPAYIFNNKIIYFFFKCLHNISPSIFVGTIHLFLKNKKI